MIRLAQLLLLLVVLASSNAFAFKMTAPHYPCSNCLNVGGSLTIGHSLRSPNNAYSLNFQADHNVVLVQTSTNTPLWSTNTANTAATVLFFQQINAAQERYVLELADSSGNVYWSARFNGGPLEPVDPFLVVQNDGNIVSINPSSDGPASPMFLRVAITTIASMLSISHPGKQYLAAPRTLTQTARFSSPVTAICPLATTMSSRS